MRCPVVVTKFALYVPLEAKPGQEQEVADFLRSTIPLVSDEPGHFVVCGKDVHLNGKVAAALTEKANAGDLFAKPPQIHTLSVLADKRP